MPNSADREQTRWLTPDQAADILHCSRITLWRWVKSGKLRAFKFGRLVRYRLADLEAMAEPVEPQKKGGSEDD